ncbi:hypothetical protein [Neolewinella agarilytica]|uniref:hypothetical protein n=1 Tax=Neolewinella agarilytica TaxID=478744 RepID=UPI002356FFC5|nr:hypothetical protein [Neolewinella agarilytica]
MTNFIKSLIPWQYSLPKKRSAIECSFRTSPGLLLAKAVRNTIEENLMVFLQEGGKFDGGRMVRTGKELYEAIEADAANTLGQFIDFPLRRNETRKFFSIATSKHREFDSIALRATNKDFSLINLESILASVDSRHFHSSYFADAEYLDLQKQNSLKRYKYTRGLKLKPNAIGNDWVDTSGRPGKGGMLPDRSGGLETGGAHYWFGDLIYDSISKERILSFDQAHDIQVLDNGIIYVNLYEGTFNGHLPENQAKQLAFRDHLGLIQS